MPNNYPARNLPSSLMPQDYHNIRLLRLVSLPVTHEMVSYIAWLSNSIVCDGDCLLPTSSESPQYPEVPDLEDFVTYVCYRSNVYTATLLCVIIYLNRLRARMPAMASGAPGTPHRLFFASLIVAAKYLNDCSPKNVHWMSCANHLFDLREINLMEKQMLFLLDFRLSFTEKEVLKDWAPLLEVHQDAVESTAGFERSLQSRTKLSAPDNFVVKVSNSLSAELMAEEKARDKVTREKAMQLVARGARQRMEKSASQHPEPVATVVKAKAPRSYQVPLKASISTPTSHSSSRSSVVSSAVKHTEEPPSYTNVHMTATVLGNILARGSSTDSVTSSLFSSTSSLTEDTGTSSSSAAFSSDEEDDYPDVVRVQASLRIEDEIASLEKTMEELADQMAGLAGIGTIMGQKERYSESGMRPVRQLQSVARPVDSNQKRLRFRMGRRSDAVATLAPQSSIDKATDDFLSSDCPRHAQPPYASSSSTITAVPSSRGLSGSSHRHHTPCVPTSTPVTGSTPSVQRQPRRTSGRFFSHKPASSNALSTAPLSLPGPRQSVLHSQVACANSPSAPLKRIERNTVRVVHAPKPMSFGASWRNFLGAVTSVSGVTGGLGSLAQGSNNTDAPFDLPPLGRGRAAPMKAEY